MALQPALSNTKASLYSHLIKEASLELNLDWRIVVAIGMQESSWKPTNTPDLGLFQLNRETARAYKINEQLFAKLGSIQYTLASFQSFILVMKDKLGQCKKYGEDAWSCYHSKTQSFRIPYMMKVSQYL